MIVIWRETRAERSVAGTITEFIRLYLTWLASLARKNKGTSSTRRLPSIRAERVTFPLQVELHQPGSRVSAVPKMWQEGGNRALVA